MPEMPGEIMELGRSSKFISFVVAGRCDMTDSVNVAHLTECNDVPPKYGRNWWYSNPTVYTNFEGLDDTVTVFEIKWLCFLFEYSDYAKVRRGR